MKSVIQLLVTLATLAGMVSWALSAHSLDEGNTTTGIIYGALFLLIVIALILLFRWDKNRIHDEELELWQRVDVKTKEALRYKQPIEFYVKRSQIVFLAFVLILCLGGLYWGIQLLALSPPTKWYGGSTFLLAGVLFCIAIGVSVKKLIDRPVIRLDLHGINHFLFGFIPWADITNIYLLFFKFRSSEISVLKVATTDNQRYLARLSRWYRFFQGGKADIELSLQLPLSEMDARFVGGVAKGYADYAGAPTVDSQMSKKITEELSRLQTPQQRMERLQAMMAESSREFVKRRQAISKTYRVTTILLIIGVFSICVGAWITSR